VNVTGEKLLAAFGGKYPRAMKPLASWLTLARSGSFRSLIDLRTTFSDVEFVSVHRHEVYVFNIGGNKYRLIATIHFKAQEMVVRGVWTHADYDTNDWKKKFR
jgi:mRNA interferase HigB